MVSVEGTLPRFVAGVLHDDPSAGFDRCGAELHEIYPDHDFGLRCFMADPRGRLHPVYRRGHPIDLGRRQLAARKETFADGVVRLVEGPDDRIVGHYPIDRRGPAIGVAEISTGHRGLLQHQREVESAIGRLSQRLRVMADRDRRQQQLDLGLAWTAHELRGPLLATRLWLEHAADALQGDVEPIGRAISELGRLARGVESLLRWAVGDEEIALTRLDLTEVVRQAAVACMAESGDERVVLDGEERLWVAGDAFHLRSAIENPIRNALRHSTPGTEVRVTVERHGPDPTVVVRNYALPTIPLEGEQIFEPFVRGRESAGAGLGLFVTRRVVERHGGTVRCRRMEDELVEFELRFPAEGRR
jgi:signal transduction histidine kinase